MPFFVVGMIIIALVVGMVGGCSMDTASRANSALTPTVTMTAPPPTNPIKSALEQAAEAQIYLAQTQQAENIIADRVADRMQSTAEAQKEFVRQTEQARSDSATQIAQNKSDSATREAQIKADNATAEAQARADAATALARADNATAFAYMAAQTEVAFAVTVTAAVVGTQTAFPMTMTAMPMINTAQAAQLLAQGTEQAGSAELVNLTVKRQTMKNGLDAYLPWILIMATFISAVLAMIVYSQFRQLKRDRNGMLSGEAVRHKNGTTFIRPDLQTGPALTVDKQGMVTETGSQSDFQQATTRRAQLVEASKGKSIQEFKQMVGMFGAPQAGGGVKFVEPDRMFGRILGEAEDDLIEGEATDV